MYNLFSVTKPTKCILNIIIVQYINCKICYDIIIITIHTKDFQNQLKSTNTVLIFIYEGWNFNFGNTPLDWIQELLE